MARQRRPPGQDGTHPWSSSGGGEQSLPGLAENLPETSTVASHDKIIQSYWLYIILLHIAYLHIPRYEAVHIFTTDFCALYKAFWSNYTDATVMFIIQFIYVI